MVTLHWPVPDEDVEEGWEALSRLQQQGKVRFIGVSNFSVEQLCRCEQIAHVDAHQVEYSLINRLAEGSILPFAEANDIGVLVYSPLKHGLLSGSMTRSKRRRCSPAEIAIAWTLARPAVTGVIVGGRRTSQFTDSARAGNVDLNSEDFAELEGWLSAN
jgi:aryl-alcohol dehydrogenase-like predicted oxidoreductase